MGTKAYAPGPREIGFEMRRREDRYGFCRDIFYLLWRGDARVVGRAILLGLCTIPKGVCCIDTVVDGIVFGCAFRV